MSLRYFEILKKPSAELLEILHHNIIGTPQHGMLYQHCGVNNKIDHIADPYYVNLVRRSRIAGTCCFCKRQTSNNGHPMTSFYIRYFSFRDTFRSRQGKKKEASRKSVLRNEITTLLGGTSLDVQTNEKFYHYAYVDPRNKRSMVLCDEFGFQAVRQFTTIIFNRLSPRPQTEVAQMMPSEQPEIKRLLVNFYREYTMFSGENLFSPRNYYIIRDANGQVVAGAQVNPERWKILSLPGLAGKLILNTFSHLPILNRLFNKDYRFLTIEGIYYQQGGEKYLQVLLEGLLARFGLNSAIIPVDADTSLYHDLKSLDLGWADKLSKEVRGHVICRFNQFNENDIRMFESNPAYISGIDVT